MQVKFDPVGKSLHIGQLSNQDIQQAEQIRETLRSEGWQILTKYWTAATQATVNHGIQQNKAELDKSKENWARLDGMLEILAIPERILIRAEDEINRRDRTDEDEQEYYVGG